MPNPPASRGGHHARIVQVALRDQHQAAAQRRFQRAGFRCQLLQKMNGRAIDKRMHRIQPQPVDVKIAHPHQRVVAEEAPHLVGPRGLKIHRAAPRRVVGIVQIRAEHAGVISHRPKVVVDHVEQHGEALAMRRIHKTLQRVGAAVGLVHGEKRHAVVSPAVMAGESRHRHQLDMRNAEVAQDNRAWRWPHPACLPA